MCIKVSQFIVIAENIEYTFIIYHLKLREAIYDFYPMRDGICFSYVLVGQSDAFPVWYSIPEVNQDLFVCCGAILNFYNLNLSLVESVFIIILLSYTSFIVMNLYNQCHIITDCTWYLIRATVITNDSYHKTISDINVSFQLNQTWPL